MREGFSIRCSKWPDSAIEIIDLIDRYGGIDGDHHKSWVLTQILKILLGDYYEIWAEERAKEDYPWDEGIAP